MNNPSEREHQRGRLQAAALRYDQEKHEAPVLAAKGSGAVAEKIIELAVRHGIPLKKDPELLRILMQLELNQEIPENVFQAVAEILAMIYRAERHFREEEARNL
ncbi:MAG: EscU/YscU/HrcU family type III secretion system export apparatus switch protein [Deltaproteobacteria bacterium]|nr:EscU/YscU/HrcU family type III secretion system export apparatus switch protein [Deltaproteobacteria bacterium]